MAQAARHGFAAMRKRTVTVNDKMQKGYRYVLSGSRRARLRSRIQAATDAGRDAAAWRVRAANIMTDCRREFPRSWFAHAKLSPRGRDPSLNFFGVDASQPLSEWRRKGWIHPDDPRGWFQWYCRYYMGRRMPDEDARQIGRWKAIRRHVRQIQKHCEPGDSALPAAPAPSIAALGLRQPQNLGRNPVEQIRQRFGTRDMRVVA